MGAKTDKLSTDKLQNVVLRPLFFPIINVKEVIYLIVNDAGLISVGDCVQHPTIAGSLTCCQECNKNLRVCLSHLKLQFNGLQKHTCQLNDETAVAPCSLSIFLTCLSPVQNVHMLYKAAAEPGFTQQPAFVWYVVCAKSSWENS